MAIPIKLPVSELEQKTTWKHKDLQQRDIL